MKLSKKLNDALFIPRGIAEFSAGILLRINLNMLLFRNYAVLSSFSVRVKTAHARSTAVTPSDFSLDLVIFRLA